MVAQPGGCGLTWPSQLGNSVEESGDSGMSAESSIYKYLALPQVEECFLGFTTSKARGDLLNVLRRNGRSCQQEWDTK